MNELGDELLSHETGGIVSRDKESGRVTVVAYNYPPEMKVSLPVTNALAAADAIDASGSARELTLNLEHLPAGASFEVEVLDRQHGDAVAAWEAMGRPEPPTREQAAELRKLAWNTKKEVLQADKDGQLHFSFNMPAWSLVLVKQM
jgi:xylan 1,4-beta-xylosidase